jgi:hypothetical protein
MGTPLAILIGLALVAAAVLFVFRWEIVAGPTTYRAVRLDRWTGSIAQCESKGFERSPELNMMVCAK